MAKRSSLGDSLIGRAYLLIYNGIQFLFWSYLFGTFLIEATSFGINNHRLWTRVRVPLLFFQSIQMVEVLHCLIGLVPSNPIITFIQIITKVFICWGIVTPFEAPKHSIGIALIIGCWSLAESTRFLYYLLNQLNSMPNLLIWCRYSFFIVLYPIGVTGELITIYSSIDEISKNPNLSLKLPNPFNMSFYSHIALLVFMLFYIPIFPVMYKHLLNQRKKVIGPHSKKA